MKRLFITLISLLLLAGILSGCSATVPKPKVKHGEFNFAVTYEFNGETKTVSGVYECEYNGTYWTLDGGHHRDWKGQIKGESFEDVIDIGTTSDGYPVALNLCLHAEYFMGENVDGYRTVIPYISIRIENEEGLSFLNDPKDVEDYCGARIISYEYDEPIENSFSLFN